MKNNSILWLYMLIAIVLIGCSFVVYKLLPKKNVQKATEKKPEITFGDLEIDGIEE